MIDRNDITDVGLGTWVLGEYMLSGETDPEDLRLEEGDIRLNDAKFTDRKAEFIEAVNEVRDYLTERNHGEDLSPLMIRWTTEQPGVTCALVGARNREQVRSNTTALDVSLDEEELQEIRAIVDRAIEEPVGPEFMAPPHSDPAT